MSGETVFIDSNVFVYAGQADQKHAKHRVAALNLLRDTAGRSVISVQVLNEFHSAMLKHKVPEADIRRLSQDMMTNTSVKLVTPATVRLSWAVRDKYGFSIWDSLIVASAIESKCSTLYTEDLQDGQLIDRKLTIRNPFKG